MGDTTAQLRHDTLDDLAFAMANATDSGDMTTARQILRQVEDAVGRADDGHDDPAPVLARRFARAHREALRLPSSGAADLPHLDEALVGCSG